MSYIPSSRGSNAGNARPGAAPRPEYYAPPAAAPSDQRSFGSSLCTKLGKYMPASSSYGECDLDVASMWTFQTLWLLANVYSVLATRFQISQFPLKGDNLVAILNGSIAIGVSFLYMFCAKYCFNSFVCTPRFGGASFAHLYAIVQLLWSGIFLGVLHLDKKSPYYQLGSSNSTAQIFFANLSTFITSGLVLGVLMGGEDPARLWRKKAGDSCLATFVLSIYCIILLVDPLKNKQKYALFGMVAFAIVCAFALTASSLKDGMERWIQFLALCSFGLSIAGAGCLSLDFSSNPSPFSEFQLGTIFTVLTAFLSTAWLVRTMTFDIGSKRPRAVLPDSRSAPPSLRGDRHSGMGMRP